MKIRAFIKKLNNTELGKSSTHDTYVLVPAGIKLEGIFKEVGLAENFVDVATKKEYSIRLRYTANNELRINGLGQYYRDKELNAGDEIIIQYIEKNDERIKTIDVNKYENTIVLQKASTNSFEVLNPERIPLVNDDIYVDGKKCNLVFYETRKKRSDSPNATDYYYLMLEDKNFGDNYSTDEVVEIKLNGRSSKIIKPCGWKLYSFSEEER